MKKKLLFGLLLSMFNFSSFSLLAADEPKKCNSQPRNLVTYSGEIVEQVRMAKDYFMNSSAPDAGSTFEERTTKLNAKIVAIFATFREMRSKDYEATRCTFKKADWCTNGNGGCSSTRTLKISKIYVMLPETMTYTRNGDMKKGPKVDNQKNTIWWQTGTHGKHAETFVQIDTKYSSAYIASTIAAEIAVIKAELNRQGLPGGGLDT